MYLTLRFEGAKIVEIKAPTKAKENPPDKRYLISHHQVSNVLHVLMGLRPVPLKRKNNTLAEMDENILNMAKKAYIQFDNDYAHKERKEGYEFIQTNKSAWNSKRSATTDYNGVNIKGIYNWDYFRRSFTYNEFSSIVDVFKVVLNTDFKLGERSLVDTVIECKKNDSYFELIQNVLSVIKNKTQWKRFLTETTKEELEKIDLNTTPNDPTPIYNNNGCGYVLSMDGHIVVNIVGEEYEQAIKNNQGTATLLDDGIVYIENFSNMLPYTEDQMIEMKFSPIFVLNE